MKVITGLYLFYFFILFQEGFNISATFFFYHAGIETEYFNRSLLISGLYFSSAILFFFPTFYKSIVIGLTSQLYASVINILVIVMDGLQSEQVSHFHIQSVMNMLIDIFKYSIGVALLAFVKTGDYYMVTM